MIDHGADLEAQDLNGWTPLIIAAMNANASTIAFLVKQGANCSVESAEGKTAREFAAEALAVEREKPRQDLKTKKRIADLARVLSLLPDEGNPTPHPNVFSDNQL